jgi:hypothetical protein
LQSKAICVSAVGVPGIEQRLGIERPAVGADLEVEMAADADRVAGLPHHADPLSGEDAVAPVDRRWPWHVGVEVASRLAFAVDQQIVAVEDRVVGAAQDPAVADRDQRRAAGRDDVESFVPAAAVAGGAELANVAAGAMRSLDREDVAVVGEAAVAGDDAGGGRCG